MANENLHKAKEAKNDEFYTQLNDVSEELRYLPSHPCDFSHELDGSAF